MSNQISDKVNNLAAALLGGFTLDTTTGATARDDKAVEAAFVAQLPEHINLKLIDEVQSELIAFGAAQTKVVGELALKAGKDLSADKVTAESKIGTTAFATSFVPKAEGKVGDKPWVKYGKAVTDITVGSGRGSNKDYKGVVNYLSEEAAKVFGA